MNPNEILFNGLRLGLEVDTSVEPRMSSRHYQNHKTKVEAFSSARLKVTTRHGKICGLSGLSFQYQDKDVGPYGSKTTVENTLGVPGAQITEFKPEVFRRAFCPPALTVSFLEQLIAWTYGDSVVVFLTKLDAYEGFVFPSHRFWSISVGDCWISHPFLD